MDSLARLFKPYLKEEFDKFGLQIQEYFHLKLNFKAKTFRYFL